MKFSVREPPTARAPQRFFALIPHQCETCGQWFWLESGFRWRAFSTLDGLVAVFRCEACQR